MLRLSISQQTTSFLSLLLLAVSAASISGHSNTSLLVDALSPDLAAASEAVAFRLPNNTRPLAYSLHLTTNVHTQTNFTFTGIVSITLEGVGNASDTITLHQRNLTIISADLVQISTPNVPVPLIEPPVYNSENEMLTFTLDPKAGQIRAGIRYILTIRYSGVLRTDAAGLYRTSYVSTSGRRLWMVATQFAPTDARHAFPCYDEPALRARFTLNITHGSDYHAISNMPTQGMPIVDDQITTTVFQETPPMPTYLVAFVVSDFAVLSNTNKFGFVQRVFARSTAIADGQFALEMGHRTLTAYEKYFGIPFALPKMDQVAIPVLSFTAMENWGLIIYKEPYLLYNTSHNSFAEERQVAVTITHEFAHQYFGNLVTPKWWSNVWLSEGFANLFENIAADWFFPSWKIMDTYALAAQSVMLVDSTNRTRPMTFYVDAPQSVYKLFDEIAYPKSGSVLHMFMHAFTESTFKIAVIDYLKRKQFSDASEEDLFDAFGAATKADRRLPVNMNASVILRSWTNQGGYPVLSVERSYTNNSITLKQQRYFSEPQTIVMPTIWWIPYNWATASSANFSETTATNWLATSNATITVSDLRTNDWLLLNKRQTGYYRVKYDTQNYDLLAAALQNDHNAIHVVSRAQLLNDAFVFAHNGYASYSVALELTKYLYDEAEYVPWAAAWQGFNEIERLLSDSPMYSKFSKYALKLVTNLYWSVDWIPTNNMLNNEQLRAQAIRWACEHGYNDCLKSAQEQLVYLIDKSQYIHPDMLTTTLCQGVRTASDTQFVQLMNILLSEDDQIIRDRYIKGLGCASSTKQLKDFVETSTENNRNLIWRSAAERYSVFLGVVNNRWGWPVATDFLRTNMNDAIRTFGNDNVNNAIEWIAAHVNSQERFEKFNSLIAAARNHPDVVLSSTILAAHRKVEENHWWLYTNRKVIEEFLNKNGASTLVASSVLVLLLVFVVNMI